MQRLTLQFYYHMKFCLSRVFVILFLWIFFTSCDVKEPIKIEEGLESLNTVNIDATWFDLEGKSINKISVEYIPLETIDNSLIGNIDDIKIAHNRIFILDRHIAKAVLIFDSKGKFINKIEAEGMGPTEISLLTDFTINRDSNEIIISDLKQKKIATYDFNGNFKKSVTRDLWFTNFEWLFEDKFLFYHSHYGLGDKDQDYGSLLSVSSLRGNDRKDFFKLYNKPAYSTIVENFNLSNNGREIVFSKKFDNTVYLIDNEVSLQSLFKVDFGKYGLKDDYRNLKVNNFKDFEFSNQLPLVKSVYSTDSFYGVSYTNPLKIKGLHLKVQLIVSKEDMNEYIAYVPSNNPTDDGIILPSIKASFQNSFYGFVEAESIISVNEQHDDVINKKFPPINNVTLNEIDNPIIVRMNINEN